jgi:integrase
MQTTTKPPKAARRRRRFGRCYPRPGGPRGAWLVQFPDPSGRKAKNGRTRYLTKSVNSEGEGKSLLAEIEKSIVLGRFALAAESALECDLTLLGAIDAYLDAKRGEGRAESGITRYLVSRRAIEASPLGDRLVREIGPKDIEGYMSWRKVRKWRATKSPGGSRTDPNVSRIVKGEKPSNSSVNRDVALISAALGRLVRLGQMERNVAHRVKKGREPTKTRAVLSKEEIARLFDACGDHFRPLVMAAYYSGQRPQELLALKWGDVSFGNRTLTVFRTKVGLGDAVPLHPELGAALKALKEKRAKDGTRVVRDDEHVFLSARGGRPGFDYRPPWLWALRRAGLDRRKGLTFYSLRHSMATHFLERGSPADLQALLGHSSLSTSMRYVRAVSDRARAGIEALEVGGSPGTTGHRAQG